ncbi:hypothetical protein TNCV_1853021 [Trichonephila clavipes]|nr:hypothetical protein TNCV_1853021 [Trichonephila clavipes]
MIKNLLISSLNSTNLEKVSKGKRAINADLRLCSGAEGMRIEATMRGRMRDARSGAETGERSNQGELPGAPAAHAGTDHLLHPDCTLIHAVDADTTLSFDKPDELYSWP